MVVVVLAVSLVVVGPVTGLVVGGVGSVQESGSQLQQATPTPTNDTTRHEHPDRIGEDGDLAAIQQWLAGRSAVRLEDCAVAIGRDTTDVCELADKYPDWMSMFVDVAEETDDEDDDEQGETFEEAAKETESLAEETDEFEETHREYQEARDSGNHTAARRHARVLIRTGRDINSTAAELVGLYVALERGSDVDLGDAKANINRTAANISAIVAQVEAEQFVATTLTAEIAPPEISFLAPGTVAGRLVTENGSGVSNEPIRLVVGGRVLRTETNATGAFSVAYRPTTIPVGADRITLRYVPRNASVYLGSSTALEVSITQVEPTVSVDVSPTAARFGDAVRVSGAVAAEDVPAPGVPLVVTVDGRSIGSVQTNAEGAFTTTAAIEAFDGPGDVSVRAAITLEDRALAAAEHETGLTVRSTATALTLSPTADGPRELTVDGTLRTADGDPVPGQQVRFRINGTAVDTARTDGDGRYRASVTVPDSLIADDGDTSVQVAAEFDGSGTNLEGSDDRAVVVLPAAASDPPGDGTGGVLGVVGSLLSDPMAAVDDRFSDPIGIGVGSLVVLILLGLLYLGWRRFRSGSPADVDGGRPPEPSSEPEPGAAPGADEPTGDRGPLAMARERLGSDADSAVMLAYAAVRESLTPAVAPASREADTHWEFLAACRQDGLDAETIESLTDLTEAYEQAAYAPVSVDRPNAESVLAAAEPLVGAAD